MATGIDYVAFFADNYQIVDKESRIVDFHCNKIQLQYLLKDMTGDDIILKARQEGFSSAIDGVICTDFLIVPNSYGVIVADNDENAQGLLQRVKFYLESYERKNSIKVPLEYDSVKNMYNKFMNTRISIGTAKNKDFGRSKTITRLHLSEAAKYPNLELIMTAAGEAVVPGGSTIIESTANGFNYFKRMYDDAKGGINGFKALFYGASLHYDHEFLQLKKKRLKEKYAQEYPDDDVECFLTSGNCFFDKSALKVYLRNARSPKACGELIETLSAASTS